MTKKENKSNICKIAIFLSIFTIILCLSGVYITTENKVVKKIIEIDFIGHGFVGCPDDSCIKITNGFDSDGMYCNVPITKCSSGEYMVEGYSICYDIWHYRNNIYLVFNVNHNYGFVDSCTIPIYEKHFKIKRRGT